MNFRPVAIAAPILLVALIGDAVARLSAGDRPSTILDILFQAGMVGAFIVFSIVSRKEERAARADEQAAVAIEREKDRLTRQEAMAEGMRHLGAIGKTLQDVGESLAILLDRTDVKPRKATVKAKG